MKKQELALHISDEITHIVRGLFCHGNMEYTLSHQQGVTFDIPNFWTAILAEIPLLSWGLGPMNIFSRTPSFRPPPSGRDGCLPEI